MCRALSHHTLPHHPVWIGTLLALAAPAVLAQSAGQVVKPPQAQAWIDIATIGGLAMPGMGGPGPSGPSGLGVLGGLFGGGGAGGAKNSFGQTQSMSAGRWVDVTLYSRANPALAEAQQAVPAGFLSPALALRSPQETRGTPPEPGDEKPVEPSDAERPKGKLHLYWGCGDAARPGQPRVVDFATATPAEIARAFQSRRATQRGTHLASGRPVWPNAADARMVPPQASLVGEHAFSGAQVPADFRFQIPAAQDLMPAIALQQQDDGGVVRLQWGALPTARAYFIAAMGSRGRDEMVVWTSSEQPDMGFGLIDYQTNPAVDRWLQEKVLLAPGTTQCSVPKGIFSGEGTMLRMIAYGSELNLAHPPRPSNPKQAWEPVWAVKLRVKSVTMAMLGQPGGAGEPAPTGEPPARPAEPADKKPSPKDLLKGIFGR